MNWRSVDTYFRGGLLIIISYLFFGRWYPFIIFSYLVIHPIPLAYKIVEQNNNIYVVTEFCV
jgi:hypothetical protein